MPERRIIDIHPISHPPSPWRGLAMQIIGLSIGITIFLLLLLFFFYVILPIILVLIVFSFLRRLFR